MRIGVFGGSFDPIHLGHLLLAEQCREQTQLDRVLFIPAAVAPLKNHKPLANDRQRVEMISLAIAGHPNFELSTLEIDRGETSFTVDTLVALKNQYPEDQFFLLIGEDSLASFANWRDPEMICKLAIPLVVGRPNRSEESVDLHLLQSFADSDRFQQIQSSRITSRLIDISSTDIRQRIQTGKSIRYLTPRAVEKYIETVKLYRD